MQHSPLPVIQIARSAFFPLVPFQPQGIKSLQALTQPFTICLSDFSNSRSRLLTWRSRSTASSVNGSRPGADSMCMVKFHPSLTDEFKFFLKRLAVNLTSLPRPRCSARSAPASGGKSAEQCIIEIESSPERLTSQRGVGTGQQTPRPNPAPP